MSTLIQIKFQVTKTALHRTRLRFAYEKIITVLLFFKALSPPAATEGLRLMHLTEIVERNFTFSFSQQSTSSHPNFE